MLISLFSTLGAKLGAVIGLTCPRSLYHSLC